MSSLSFHPRLRATGNNSINSVIYFRHHTHTLYHQDTVPKFFCEVTVKTIALLFTRCFVGPKKQRPTTNPFVASRNPKGDVRTRASSKRNYDDPKVCVSLRVFFCDCVCDCVNKKLVINIAAPDPCTILAIHVRNKKEKNGARSGNRTRDLAIPSRPP